jgi:hypothetical protein
MAWALGILSLIAAVLMAAARTGPKEAFSNLSQWGGRVGIGRPIWLRNKFVDRAVIAAGSAIWMCFIVYWEYRWLAPVSVINLTVTFKYKGIDNWNLPQVSVTYYIINNKEDVVVIKESPLAAVVSPQPQASPHFF